VTINGDLAKSGTVTFHPLAKDGKISIGRIYPDGSFSMRTGQGDLRESDGGTVPSGEYIVTVAVNAPSDESVTVGEGGPPQAGAYLMHSRYLRKETSDLKKTVEPGENVFVLDLEAAEPMPPADSEAAEQATDSKDDADTKDAADKNGASTTGESPQSPVGEKSP
jgi:hypothetical protein